MLERFTQRKIDPLDSRIEKLLHEMDEFGPGTPEYNDALTNLERLHKLKEGNRRERVKSDTIVIAACNIVGILIIVGYERSHVMITRAKDHILKANL